MLKSALSLLLAISIGAVTAAWSQSPQPAAQARLLRDTWLPDSHIMAARKKAESSDGLYLACIAADNGKSHSHNDTGSFWVYSQGLPVLMDMGQETYQKKSFDAHRRCETLPALPAWLSLRSGFSCEERCY